MRSGVKLAFHDADTDTDIFARILADTSDTRDFLELFLWQAERHADILATILASMSTRMSVSVSVSWKAGIPRRQHRHQHRYSHRHSCEDRRENVGVLFILTQE